MSNFFESRRILLGKSQRHMAARMGVSNTTIAAWENNKSIPKCSIPSLMNSYQTSRENIEKALTVLRREIEAREKQLTK